MTLISSDFLDHELYLICWETTEFVKFILKVAINFFPFFTVLIWLYDEPKGFTGGDLIFNDFDVTIPCKNNTGVIFLGPWHHEVTEVKGQGRYTLTMFTSNGSD